MNKEPARVYRVEEPQPIIDFESFILLHPSAIIMGLGIVILIIGALIFALTGHAAVDSGGMRNFFASGV